jgi:small subunit ribosomal protein S6e
MAEIKVVLSNPKTGKSYQKVLKDEDSKRLMGLKIGDKLQGESIDLAGYEFEITGGSDFAGFPMRKDVQGIGRKKILATHGVGLRKKRNARGVKIRKSVAANTIYDKTAQVNMKVLKEGKMPLGEDKVKEEKKEGQEDGKQ